MPPQAGQTRRERLEAREETILVAAHDVFVENGFKGAKMADIARRAQVAEGTVYLYFKSKNALLEAVIARFYEGLTQGAQEGVQTIAGTFERFAFLARHHLSRCMQEWHVLELMIGHYRKRPDYENRGYQLNKAYVAVFDRVFREGVARAELRDDVPLWVVRDMFYGTLEYTARTLILRRSGEDEMDGAAKHALGLLRRGVQTTAPAERTDETGLEVITRRLERIAARLDQG